MALTFADAGLGESAPVRFGGVTNNSKLALKKVTYDNSYATGGEALVASDLGLQVINGVFASPASGYVFKYDYANGKLKAFYANYPAGAAGALTKVAATTDLSAVVTYVVGIGR